jgi:hypothetical protein
LDVMLAARPSFGRRTFQSPSERPITVFRVCPFRSHAPPLGEIDRQACPDGRCLRHRAMSRPKKQPLSHMPRTVTVTVTSVNAVVVSRRSATGVAPRAYGFEPDCGPRLHRLFLQNRTTRPAASRALDPCRPNRLPSAPRRRRGSMHSGRAQKGYPLFAVDSQIYPLVKGLNWIGWLNYVSSSEWQ